MPTGFKASSVSSFLDKWILKQKAKFKKNELSRNHIRLLEAAGLDLTARKKHDGGKSALKWKSRFQDLILFK